MVIVCRICKDRVYEWINEAREMLNVCEFAVDQLVPIVYQSLLHVAITTITMAEGCCYAKGD